LKRLKGERSLDEWENRFSAQASRGVIRHMSEDEEGVGVSWEMFRPA
jgi:hypothetical protein